MFIWLVMPTNVGYRHLSVANEPALNRCDCFWAWIAIACQLAIQAHRIISHQYASSSSQVARSGNSISPSQAVSFHRLVRHGKLSADESSVGITTVLFVLLISDLDLIQLPLRMFSGRVSGAA